MESFDGKIKTVAQLRELIGARPRTKTVIMCHGVFDVVHVGHVRHLLYAKGKADILIANLTTDAHIDKGMYRPHVPQDLRAMNMAAFEMVDYVVIDQSATPVENILALQPDYFAKGYEYQDAGLTRTADEVSALATYGGQILFTPGDVVYSSSHLIDLAPPRLRCEKLLSAMERDVLTFELLRTALAGMAGKRVHVVGDTIVDSYTHATATGGASKTPTLSVLMERRDDFLGGAGVVARHLKAAGADVVFSSVAGDDEPGRFARAQLAGIECNLIVDPTRPTTNKHAIVAGGYRLLKIDTLDNRTISDDIMAALCQQIGGTPADAVVFSDFRHGIFNRRTVPLLVDAIRAPFRAADSQVASRWGNICDFQGFDLICPNEREARFALGDQDSGVRALGTALHSAAKCRALIMKLGERGVVACRGDGLEDLDAFVALDSFSGPVVDSVGAGDALLAYAVLSMLTTGSLAVAAILGSVAAALECEREGNVSISPVEMLGRLNAIEAETKYHV